MECTDQCQLEHHVKSHYGNTKNPDPTINQSLQSITQTGLNIHGNLTMPSEISGVTGTQSVLPIQAATSLLSDIKPTSTGLQLPGMSQIQDYQQPTVLPNNGTLLVSCLTNALYPSMS